MNLNSENNQIKEMNKTSFHKRVFSGISTNKFSNKYK